MDKLEQPICANCGYDLSGAVSSPTCPECGRPLVEVLQRKPGNAAPGYRRYRSKATLFGHPLVDIAYGPDPGERMGHAKGVIALGDAATGLVAIGGFAVGGLAIGGVAIGVIAFGGVSGGIVGANGGVAAAGLAALGGVAVSGYYALGGLAVGHIGVGGIFVPVW